MIEGDIYAVCRACRGSKVLARLDTFELCPRCGGDGYERVRENPRLFVVLYEPLTGSHRRRVIGPFDQVYMIGERVKIVGRNGSHLPSAEVAAFTPDGWTVPDDELKEIYRFVGISAEFKPYGY